MIQDRHLTSEVSVGSTLAAAREALNLSVSDVARHLKLSPVQVEALEKGAYERLPGRVFVRGFLRNYAKLLGLDPQPLLSSIEAQMPQPAAMRERPASPQVVMPRERPSRWPLNVAVAAIVIVGGLAVYEFGFNEVPQTSVSDEVPSDGTPGAVAAVPAATGPGEPSTALPAPVSTPATAGAGGTAPAAAGGGELVAVREAAPHQPAKAAHSGERELHFRFEEESWVEVRDRNDKVIFSRLNRAGSEERVSANPPLKLVVGNARGVRLNYEDQPVDLVPHTGLAVARFTLE